MSRIFRTPVPVFVAMTLGAVAVDFGSHGFCWAISQAIADQVAGSWGADPARFVARAAAWAFGLTAAILVLTAIIHAFDGRNSRRQRLTACIPMVLCGLSCAGFAALVFTC